MIAAKPGLEETDDMGKVRSNNASAKELKRMVGKNLALAREAIGWYQADMVQAYADFPLTPPKLSEWESGRYYPDPRFLVTLCRDHGFSMDWFYRAETFGVIAKHAANLRRAKRSAAAA
jgi:transcriptional regulator with XRE-family HTH domain